MKLLSFDPSGNFDEGKGTTGYSINENGEFIEVSEISSKQYDRPEAYWQAHIDLIRFVAPDHVVFEGYRLYHHKGMSASAQANSTLETPQLIGVLKITLYSSNIPYTIQFATDVKNRWKEEILVHKGYLTQKGKSLYWNGQLTSTHKRDSMKHALHYLKYRAGETP